MKFFVFSLLAGLLWCAQTWHAAYADDAQPPQLLGVWYGTYELVDEAPAQKAQMWMLVSWQLSKDGWNIAGHNRWNIVPADSQHPHAPANAGAEAEHFERFGGTIAPDARSLVINEKTTGNRIQAQLLDANTMQAQVSDKNGKRLFEVQLSRIDTDYTPGEAVTMGVDVSHHSGAVDWDKVKAAGFDFAYIKASEGVDNPDAMFDSHWQGIQSSGMARGAYHFYVTEDDPVEQATFFASRLGDDPGELPPAVDVELLGHHTDTQRMTETLKVFLATLEQKTGVKPMVYSDSKFWDVYYEPVFGDYPLWMAEYGVHMPKPPFGWDNWLFWQHAQNQIVDGVEKNADINLLHPRQPLSTLTTAGGKAGGG
jgi:lysozyme